MKKVSINELTAGARVKFMITGEEYKQRQTLFLNDKINGAYYQDFKGRVYMKLNTREALIGNEKEVKDSTLKRAKRFRALVAGNIKVVNIDIQVKTNIDGFKQWCNVEKHYTDVYKYYRIINKNGRYIDYDLNAIEKAVHRTGDFITVFKRGGEHE